MAERKGKRTFIALSSSSDEEEPVDHGSDDDDDDDDEDEDYDDDYDDEEEEDSEEGDNNGDVDGDDESLCNKIIRLLKEDDELDCLKLKDCKAYLRKYGLRVAGTKSVCLQRIKEHWRLKDGNGEALYPRSSFVINCTGDVCNGDVVLFTQKVFERFDKVTRHGKIIGKRTVAGRVVKESYGAAKQQHTFTRWSNESVRINVLTEKHKRGAAARLERTMKKTKKLTATRGTKGQAKIPSAGLSQKRKTSETKKRGDYFDRRGKTPLVESRIHNDSQDTAFRSSERFREYQKFTRPSTSEVPRFQSHTNPPRIHHQSQIRSQYRDSPYGGPYPIFRHDRSSAPTMIRLPLRTSADTFVMSSPQFEHFDYNVHTNHASMIPGYNLELRNWSGFPGPDSHRSLHPFIPGSKTYRQRK